MAKILNMDDLLKDEVELIKNYRKASDDAKASISEYAASAANGWGTQATAEGISSGIPDDGLIHLHNLSFDFEEYFDRGLEQMSEGEREEFKARIYGLFCRDVFLSGGDMRRVSFWAANYVAERLYQALGGVPWEDIMGLPWDEPTPFFTAKGQRAFEIYAAITNSLAQNPDANTTDLIAQQATKHCVSYETARADYYTWKKIRTGDEGVPKKFLNKPIED
jgi:hypothetical protein